MVSMVTRSVILLKNGTTPTNSIISQRPFILENKTWYQINVHCFSITFRHWPFIPLSNIQTTITFLINAQAFIRTITFHREESG